MVVSSTTKEKYNSLSSFYNSSSPVTVYSSEANYVFLYGRSDSSIIFYPGISSVLSQGEHSTNGHNEEVHGPLPSLPRPTHTHYSTSRPWVHLTRSGVWRNTNGTQSYWSIYAASHKNCAGYDWCRSGRWSRHRYIGKLLIELKDCWELQSVYSLLGNCYSRL